MSGAPYAHRDRPCRETCHHRSDMGTRSPRGVDWPHGDARRDAAHAPVRLVHATRRRCARAGAALRRSWQYAARARPGRGARPADDRLGRARCRSCSPAPATASSAASSTSAATGATCSATGDARRETIQCPYHAWTYASTGRSAARRAPTASRASTGRRSASCQVSVDTWGPFVFVNPDPTAEPLAEALGELPALLADGRHRRRRAALPRTGRVRRVRVQLEGLRRELPRVLPLRRRAPEPDEGDRRVARRATRWRSATGSRRRSARRGTAAAASTTRRARSSAGSSTSSSRPRSST